MAEIVNFTFGSLPMVIFFAHGCGGQSHARGAHRANRNRCRRRAGPLVGRRGGSRIPERGGRPFPELSGRTIPQWEASFRVSSLPGVTFYAALATRTVKPLSSTPITVCTKGAARSRRLRRKV